MHTDLAPHLHSQECNTLIELLNKCRENHPFRKYFGRCNSLDHQLTVCLKNERLARRQRNYEKSLESKKRLQENAKANVG